MYSISVFGIPNCDQVKKTRAWFDAQGKPYAFVDIKKQALDPQWLREWAQQLGWERLLNTQGSTWRGLDANTKQGARDAASAIALILAHPSLMKRPVVVAGSVVTLGYRPELWAAL